MQLEFLGLWVVVIVDLISFSEDGLQFFPSPLVDSIPMNPLTHAWHSTAGKFYSQDEISKKTTFCSFTATRLWRWRYKDLSKTFINTF